jgi:hypothetical protein
VFCFVLILIFCLNFQTFFSGKIEGRHFFDEHSLLCQIVGKICTISCISSLGSIMFLSFNRYVFICHNPYYNKLFSRRACIIMCVILYCIGLTLVLLNSVGVGDHSFDDKSLECIWDRMATYSYTVVFSVGLVWIPLLVVGISYISLFKFVLRKRKQIAAANNTNRPLKLARTIFIVYAVFSVCWIPFAVLIVADAEDTFPHEVHLLITVFAHLHPSMNWLIYYLTNGNFKSGFHKLLKINPSSIHVLQLNDSNHKCGPTSSSVNNSKPKLISSVNKKGTSSKI